jgi:hypothetical protein
MLRFSMLILLCCVPVQAQQRVFVEKDAAALGFDSQRLSLIDDVVQEGLDQSKMSGCVVVVGRREGVAFRKAFGFKQTLIWRL